MAEQSFPPDRRRLLARQWTSFLALTALAGLSVFQLITGGFNPLSAFALLGLGISVIFLPAFLYRVVLLYQVHYSLQEKGALAITFGLQKTIIPLDEITEIRSGAGITASIRAQAPGWFHSWQGVKPALNAPFINWQATSAGENLLLVLTADTAVAISPADPVLFTRSLSDLASRGILEKNQAEHFQPGPVLLDILLNRPAQITLAFGYCLNLFLGALLIGLLPGLPANQYFTFDATGNPSSPGDPARLLLIPMAGGVVWLTNSFLGWLIWRRGERQAALAFWLASAAVSLGLWLAIFLLLRAK